LISLFYFFFPKWKYDDEGIRKRGLKGWKFLSWKEVRSVSKVSMRSGPSYIVKFKTGLNLYIDNITTAHRLTVLGDVLRYVHQQNPEAEIEGKILVHFKIIQENECPKCGSISEKEIRYCGKCGYDLSLND
jgi:ribosomal protein S27AE